MKMVPLRATLLTLCLFTLLTYGKSNTPIHKGMEGESDNPGFVPDLLGWKWKLRGAKMLAWYEHYYGDFACDTNCTIDTSSFASTEFVCTSDGVDIGNPYCTTGEVYIDCKSSEFDKDPTNEYSIVSPGSCSCPSDCSGHGTCGFDGCTCYPGYTGEDCKLVNCSNQDCHGRGTCQHMDDLEIDTCVCEGGFSTNDCASEMSELPAIPNLLDVDQYTSWDKYGDESPIFNESTIAQIYITVDPEDLATLILPSNQDVRIYKHANFSFYNGATEERMEDVGFRIKGGASRAFAKKSWKISFSHFVDDRKWAQQKKISLKSAAMDPVFLRERSSFAAIRSMGGPVQRSSFATLYINGQYWGLYVLLEEAGSNQFLKSRFGNDDGSLWKITGGNALKYRGPDQEVYRNNSKFVPMNDGAEESYEPLINFLDILNNCPDDEFEEKIQTVMDIEFYLRTFVAEVVTGNWDGCFDGNNYYLYYNTDKLFYYYRYDVDVSFGDSEAWFKGSTRNVWLWGKAGFGHRLIQRILSVPSFQNTYSTYLMKVISYVNWTPGDAYAKRIETMHQEISPPALADKWHQIDQSAWSVSDFKNNVHTQILRPNVYPPQNIFVGPEITIFLGMSEFLTTRVETIKQQVADGPPQ